MVIKEGLMEQIKEGETYTGDELVKAIFGGEESFIDERDTIALENDQMVVVGVDAGNDNWYITHVFPK
jgi:hypothetical protein